MAVDINAWYSYRHSLTGLVGVYPARLGESDPYLKRVRADAKPLAYTPIPREAVEAVLANTESTEGDSSVTETEE